MVSRVCLLHVCMLYERYARHGYRQKPPNPLQMHNSKGAPRTQPVGWGPRAPSLVLRVHCTGAALPHQVPVACLGHGQHPGQHWKVDRPGRGFDPAEKQYGRLSDQASLGCEHADITGAACLRSTPTGQSAGRRGVRHVVCLGHQASPAVTGAGAAGCVGPHWRSRWHPWAPITGSGGAGCT